MTATGVLRKFDDIGRINIPREIRERLGISENDFMEIFLNGEDIVLRKYQTKEN